MQAVRQIQPIFVGEAKSLDFLNSIIRPSTGVIDCMETGQDVLQWFVLSGLATQKEIKALARDTDRLETSVQDIRSFREAFRAFIAEVSQDPTVVSGHSMIDEVNRILSNATQVLQIKAGAEIATHPYQLGYQLQLRGPEDLLPRIAQACAQLICEADLRFVKNCEAEDCSLYFLDVSKSHRRRWCSMDLCGNRAKAAAYRKSKQRQ